MAIVHWFYCSSKCPFLLCKHLAEEERAGCFTLFSFFAVPWFYLLSVIEAFSGHAHLRYD